MPIEPLREPGAASASTPGIAGIALAALAVSLAGLLFGYDTGVASGISHYLGEYFHLSAAQVGFAIACLDLGCIAGALCAGTLADRFGRKRVLIFCALVFMLSGVLSAIPHTVTELVLARVLGGLAIGASSMVAPVYIAEIAPEKHRGRLGSLYQLGIVVGIAVVYWVNYLILTWGKTAHTNVAVAHGAHWNAQYGWRYMLGSEVIPAVVFFCMLLFINESPRWQIVNGREAEARKTLTRFFGPAKAESEIAAVRQVSSAEEGRFSELFTPRYRLPLMIALFLAIFSQFSGINSIIYYAPRIFAAAGMKTTNAFGSTALIGMVNLAFTFIAVGFVDRAGRKLLLAIGTAIQVFALAAVAVIFALAHQEPAFKTKAGTHYQGLMAHAKFLAMARGAHATVAMAPHFTGTQVDILLGSILLFIAAFAMAMGPMPWIIISEIFPARIRGRAASVGVLTLWAAVFVIAQTFPVLKRDIGLTALYFIYAGCSLVSFLFVIFVLPETKGRTLEEIEASWRSPAAAGN